MTDVTTEEAVDNIPEAFDPPPIDSKYRMIILAAQRSKQLQRGAISRVDIDTRKHKATRVAMRALAAGKGNFSFTDQADSDAASENSSEQ